MKALWLYFICNLAFATPLHWKINKDHSEILFEVNYLTVSSVSGRFRDFSGEIFFDEDLELPKQIKLSIKTRSIFTGNVTRDGHLRSSDFLAAESHPQILFKSEKVMATSPGKFHVEGTLHLKKIKKKVTIPISLSKVVTDSWDHQSRFVDFVAIIDREDFGLDWNKSVKGSELLVGKKVKLSGKFQIQPWNKKTPSSKHMLAIKKGSKDAQTPKLERAKGKTPEIHIKTVEKEIVVDPRSSVKWQVAFFILSGIGFIGSCIGGFYLKKIFLDRYKEKYREVGVMGVTTDPLAILFLFIYSWAVWFVGWGKL